MTQKVEMQKCEICGMELPQVDYGDGVFGEHPELSWIEGRVACYEHVDDLMAKVESEANDG